MLNNPERYEGNIVMTRVRLARNVVDYPFRIKNVDLAKDLVKKVNRALVRSDTFDLLFIDNFNDVKLESMKERHLISQNLIDNREFSAVLINQDQSVSVMINEEDHIRAQCFMRGLRLREAYDRICKIDDDLSKNLDIAYDQTFGYLTACPSNLGTGMRASVMLFLPALTESGYIADMISEMSSRGLTVRGLYGEGSQAEGYMYQVSNEVTLGVSEEDIIESVELAVSQICQAEYDYMKMNFKNNELLTMDRAKKSFGVLTNAVMLSYKEFLSHIAQVKLGAMLGVMDIQDISAIDELIVDVRPANVCEQYGKSLSKTNRDLFRAEIVGKKLLKIRG